jgi:hypothetical protein
MRVLVAFAVTVSAALVLARAGGAGTPDRPSGVSAEDWVPLSGSLGLVFVHYDPTAMLGRAPQANSDTQESSPPAVASRLQASPTDLIAPTIPLVRSALVRSEARAGEPVHGYLMVKQGQLWRRLVVAA